ncbi:putative bifunctional diguanylate cyclase/phosphodiesterase [Pararobbsia silviterrae]|uniref:EAL domain-containing protein n=1 Tax=Pararobbsia silviterrae TaxID=1792498 RepID=A0A494Y9Z6_9BURK|nr:GGDEF and EAL domain-containing protein [Pararobbsia silviterrae]RKP58540.1 EAL domain-containing protein [Pararobbsia silviterrae]
MTAPDSRRVASEYMTPLLGLVEALAEGVLLCFGSRAIIYANQAAARILGTTRDALLDPLAPRFVHTVLDEHGRPLRRRDWPDARALRTGETVREAFVGLVNTRDNSVRWLVVTCQPLADDACGAPSASSPSGATGALEAADGAAARRGRCVMISFEDVTEVREARRRVRFLATHDSLTGLFNRAAFEQTAGAALPRAKLRGASTALLYIDLDRFKGVNDAFGHAVGDGLLVELARRFEKIVGPAGHIARWGGDEFLVLLDDAREAEAVAQRLIDIAAEPCALGSLSVSIGLSIGIAIAPEHGLDLATLLRHADTAMYRAKEHGRHQAEIFNPEMNAHLERRARVEAGLRRALDRNELSIVYQPVTDLRSAEMTGVEALLRWRSADLGEVAPAEFVPLAEETGLIVPIGEWAMKQVFGQAARWQTLQSAHAATLAPGTPRRVPLRVALNVSAKQLLWSNLADTVEQALGESGAMPRRLDFELTESLLLQDSATLALNLTRLQKMGIHFSIDDFGTGYASMSYLLRFPISTLKIDKSFIGRVPGDRDAMSIAEAIVAMSSALGLRCIAEGVETDAQLEFLRMVDCDAVQGFRVARPLDADEISRRLLTPLDAETVGPLQ